MDSLYDMDTYWGRCQHFFWQQNPYNLWRIYNDEENIKRTIELYKRPGNEGGDVVTEEEYWTAKYAHDSAFHPVTGNKVNMLGRMSFQAPGNCILTGCMITFYKNPLAVVGLQIANQTFNSNVNFSNSSADVSVATLFKRKFDGDATVNESKLFDNWASATGIASGISLLLNKLAGQMPKVQRFMPFVTVVLANCINLPVSRRTELVDAHANDWEALSYCWLPTSNQQQRASINTAGIPLYDDGGNLVGLSPEMGRNSIQQVVLSRVCMAFPPMFILPPIIEQLKQPGRILSRSPKSEIFISMALVFCLLCLVTPAACAGWPQMQRVPIDKLENDELTKQLARQKIDYVNFDKGL